MTTGEAILTIVLIIQAGIIGACLGIIQHRDTLPPSDPKR